ncbi:BON domain-containing protein [Ideonella sp. BN130291]|uniref:BON domain-containing protein n=1 Tax=Ideonella sp. BN130291 TaxID=3112940 RepID=UPI002E267758|nr:BON domain-containing protein [Ideonella sp. BN130291]
MSLSTQSLAAHVPVFRQAAAALLAALALGSAAAASPKAAAKPAAAPSAPARPAAACSPAEASFFRDEALTMKVASKLQFTKALFREKVNVKVTGGVAMLWGGLSSEEAIRTAVKAASEVAGVTCVNNQLKVGPPEPDTPAHTGNAG